MVAVSDIFYGYLSRMALNGDTECARLLARGAAKRLEGNEPLPAPLRDHLAAALRAGAAGKSVDSAFGLKRRKGQKQPHEDYEMQVAGLVATFRYTLKVPLRDREGWSEGKKPVTGAYSLAAKYAAEAGIKHPKGKQITADMAESCWKKHRHRDNIYASGRIPNDSGLRSSLFSAVTKKGKK